MRRSIASRVIGDEGIRKCYFRAFVNLKWRDEKIGGFMKMILGGMLEPSKIGFWSLVKIRHGPNE